MCKLTAYYYRQLVFFVRKVIILQDDNRLAPLSQRWREAPLLSCAAIAAMRRKKLHFRDFFQQLLRSDH